MLSEINRRTKNNPVLIGEPTAVAGLAQKIVDGDVPHKLVVRQSPDVTIQTRKSDLMHLRTNKIWKNQTWGHHPLYRRTMKLLVQTAGDGNMDAGNILKPALARGELQMIVTTQ